MPRVREIEDDSGDAPPQRTRQPIRPIGARTVTIDRNGFGQQLQGRQQIEKPAVAGVLNSHPVPPLGGGHQHPLYGVERTSRDRQRRPHDAVLGQEPLGRSGQDGKHGGLTVEAWGEIQR